MGVMVMKKSGLNIYHRKDGRWEGRYKCGYGDNGKILYRSVYGKSYNDVKNILTQKLSEKEIPCNKCKNNIKEISEIWLNSKRSSVKESTYAGYVMKLNKHIIPEYGILNYDILSEEMIYEFVHKKRKQGLSDKYISDIVVILKSISKFCYEKYGFKNNLQNLKISFHKVKNQKKILSESDQIKLINALISENSISSCGILLALLTGIRIGELCALKWCDFDFENNIFTISKIVQRIENVSYNLKSNATEIIIGSPKSISSFRQIPIPGFMISYLKKFKSKDDYYILSCKNNPIEPRTMEYRFDKIIKKYNLPKITFHSLRHMFATNCIAMGLDLKTLSEILGHSRPDFTMNIYVHSSDKRKISFMNSFSEKLIYELNV